MTRSEFVVEVERCQEDLRRFLTALCCGNTDMADDLAQDSLMKAYIALDSFRSQCLFKTWIFRIAYTTFISSRRAVRPLEPIDAAASVAGASRADDAFRNQALYAALQRLSEKERSAILLYYMQGYAVGEVAAITDSSEDAVKKLLSRGRSHLKDFLSE
ncbi:MAG: RNA polymerase sigma factor [Muribaculaceae bacterium]|nr:RNA polymerase sigma factor [Muribaculaceae bacterium]